MHAPRLLAPLLLLVACHGDQDAAPVPDDAVEDALVTIAAFEASEAVFDATYAATPIGLSGRVVEENGAPVAGAQVTTIAWGSGAGNAGRTATSAADGTFVLAGLTRRSLLLRVTHAGHYAEIIPVDLHRPLGESSVAAEAIVMSERRVGRARMIFAGDTMFGRRFVDADEDGVEGEPGDLIRAGSRQVDATQLFAFTRDVLAAADFTQVNLESTVTDDPATPHPYKTFVYYSHPETILALPAVGIDAVSLGNNHVYDYLEDGLADTIAEVERTGLAWFGSGPSESAARATRLHATIGGGVDVALQGFDQIVNDGTMLARYRLVARDAPGQKGGALELSSANADDFMGAESPERLVIPVLHGGAEYSAYPDQRMRARFVEMVEQGAGLVVAHHPHTVQGVGVVDAGAGAGPVFVLMSLGNLVFDQDVFETFQSYLAVVDVDGRQVHRVQLVPFHAEGYVPRLVSGAAIGRAGRHVGHLSTTLPGGDALVGATVFPSGARIVALADASAARTSERTRTLTVATPAGRSGPIEIERSAAADVLAGVSVTGSGASCDVGRDLMLHGGFEDEDVDDAFHEGAMWDQTASHRLENSVVRSGIGAAVLLRSASNTGKASLYMSNRISFDATRPLTLVGQVRGDNAGVFDIEVAWYSSGGTRLSSSVVHTRAAATYAWQRFVVDLAAPAGATSLRPYYRGAPPERGDAATFLDDVALIEWQPGSTTLATPNEWSFVRCAAPGRSSLDLTFTQRVYEL